MSRVFDVGYEEIVGAAPGGGRPNDLMGFGALTAEQAETVDYIYNVLATPACIPENVTEDTWRAAGGDIAMGMEAPARIGVLINRLIGLGIMPAGYSKPTIMDKSVADAVAKYQALVGLEPNGIVDIVTWYSINQAHYFVYEKKVLQPFGPTSGPAPAATGAPRLNDLDVLYNEAQQTLYGAGSGKTPVNAGGETTTAGSANTEAAKQQAKADAVGRTPTSAAGEASTPFNPLTDKTKKTAMGGGVVLLVAALAYFMLKGKK